MLANVGLLRFTCITGLVIDVVEPVPDTTIAPSAVPMDPFYKRKIAYKTSRLGQSQPITFFLPVLLNLLFLADLLM